MVSDASAGRPGGTVPAAWRAWSPGTRVVVRRRRDLPPDAPPHEPRFTDVLGDVLRVDDDGVLVRTRRGDVLVPAAAIALTKVVPPAPPRRPR